MRSTLPTPSYFSRDGVRDIHADGAGVIGDEPAHRRRVQSADPAGAQAEPRQRVGDVVLAAADPDFERGANSIRPCSGGERRIMHSPRATRSNSHLSADFTSNPLLTLLLLLC